MYDLPGIWDPILFWQPPSCVPQKRHSRCQRGEGSLFFKAGRLAVSGQTTVTAPTAHLVCPEVPLPAVGWKSPGT